MKRMECKSIDLRGRPLEVGSVIRLNGKLCVVTCYDVDYYHHGYIGKPIELWTIEML